MTQDQLTLLLLKIAIPAAVASLLGWVLVYGRLQSWWRDVIGINLVTLAVISACQLLLLSAAVFIRLSPLDNRVVSWAYTVLTLAITPVMIWRTVVWVRASKKGDGS